MTIFSPLEQFYFLPALVINFADFFFITIDNFLITIITLAFLLTIFYLMLVKDTTSLDLYMIPNRWQYFLESLFIAVDGIIKENIQTNNRGRFYPLVISLFLFILSINLFGIFPFTFTLTSQLVVTFAIGLAVFIGIHIIAVRVHKLKVFALFFPSGVSVALALLLVPIELISFIFKPISISIRLFANMMAGHTLLKVIAGFVWSIMSAAGLFSLVHYIPLVILIILFALETGVAIIQAFVFTVLICIYINDIYNIH